MKKNVFVWLSVFLFVFGLINFYSDHSLGQSTPALPDTYSITLTNKAETTTLNNVNALNITYNIAGGTADLESSFTLKATGASTLLSNVDVAKKIITVVLNGLVTDGKITITGKLKSGSVTGNPVLSIVKVAKAGDVDITSGLTIEALFNLGQVVASPTPTPTATPESTPTPAPEATPTPAASPTGPSIKVFGPDELELRSTGINIAKITIRQTGFTALSKCTAKSSESFFKLRTKKFILGPAIKKKQIIGKISLGDVVDLIDKGLDGTVTVSVSCTNGASGSKEIAITIPEE